jgi:chromosome segregation protein
MRIARLELFGFKSFPDRTVFEFGSGVSCVVGPNGSGKSNVVDAMRWCIGEQSARSLRGSDMMDVIFSGSQDRAPVGFAEVRFTLSADTGEPFPGEYAQMAEVQVGRRLHRNGTSEYSLNGVKCRRRDIVDLFLDTGVGNNLYSFIAQGQVERIVHASAMDRRTLIDEAAGISRYTARRAEAQQRLEATGAQLDRAADVSDEMQRRLGTLERQVVKAANFRRLRALIKQEQTFLSLVQYRELAADRRALRETLRHTQNQAASNRRELLRRNNDLVDRREELAVVEAAASKWRDEVAEFDAQRRELEAARVFQGQREAELKQQSTQSDGVAEEASTAAQREGQQLAESQAAAADAQALLDAGGDERDRHQALVDRATTARRAAAVRLEEAARARQQIASRRAAAEARVRGAQGEIDRAIARRGTVQAQDVESAAEVARRKAAATAVAAAIGLAKRALGLSRGAASDVAMAVSQAEQVRSAAARGVADADGAVDEARSTVDAAVDQAAGAAEDQRREAADALVRVEKELEQAMARARDDLSRLEEGARQGIERRNLLRRDQLEDAIDQLSKHDATLAGLEGRRNRHLAELAGIDATLACDVSGLDDQRPVIDRLGLEPEATREWATRVGDRLWLPVVSSAGQLEAIRQTLAEGEGAKLLLARSEDPREHWRRAWTVCASLPDAVQAHLDSGSGAIAPGVRIDPDGVVLLGASASADRAMALQDRRAGLRESVDTLKRERERVELAWEASAARVEALSGTRDPDQARTNLQQARASELDALTNPDAQAAPEVHQARLRVAQARHALHEGMEVGRQQIREARDRVEDAVVAVAGARDLARVAGEHTIALARQRRAECHAMLEHASVEFAAVESQSKEAQRAAGQAEVAVSRAEGDGRLAIAAVQQAEAAVASAAARLQEIDEVVIRARGAAQAAQGDVDTADGQAGQADGEVESLRLALGADALVEREARTDQAKQTASSGALQARRDAALVAAAQAKDRLADARARQQRAAASGSELRQASAQAAQAARQAETDRLAVETRRAASWDRLQRERTRGTKLREALASAEAAGRGLQQQADTFAAAVANCESKGAQVRVDLEILRRGMEDRYQISLAAMLDRLQVGPIELAPDEAVAVPIEVAGRTVDGVLPIQVTRALLENADHIQAVVAANTDHRQQVDRLGEVHIGALDEYQDLSTRHGELVTQRQDLEASVADIRRAIARMNRTCRQRFRDAFDRVNEAFQVMYPRLVGGGSARLSLTDEEDLLQTGVEIYVQPPGKRLQNLTLLSGGEKAMTAIALVISVFKVRPSPFCVLDEVDAPLDEANGARFNEILREMSRISQFVVITHNRKTMEVADTLYGVTMARPGVSKLVSVNLD